MKIALILLGIAAWYVFAAYLLKWSKLANDDDRGDRGGTVVFWVLSPVTYPIFLAVFLAVTFTDGFSEWFHNWLKGTK